MGEKPSLAIIASDNDDLPSPLRLPSLRRPQVRRFPPVVSSVRPPGLKFAGSSSSSATVRTARSKLTCPLTRFTLGACGKTSLLCCFALGEFPKEYVRTRIAALLTC